MYFFWDFSAVTLWGQNLTADLYYAGKISRQEAEYLLTFCNNPSPAFLITYVGHICLEGKLHIGFLVRILLLSDHDLHVFFSCFTFYRKNVTAFLLYAKNI